MNDGTSSDVCSLQYVKVDDAAREVVIQGRGAWLVKIDVQHAYT